MDNQSFTCSITVPVTPAGAYDAITRVPEWWAKHVEGSTTAEGEMFTTRFGETFGVFRITEAVPGSKLAWETVDCYLPIFKNVRDWDGTTIEWKIEPVESGAAIQFTHNGLVPGKECYEDCKGGWTFFVTESLYKLITEGRGMPGVGIRATINSSNSTYKGTLFFKNDPLPDFAGDFVLIDVKELVGEHVVAANMATPLNREEFKPGQITGKHYMLVENVPVVKGINPLDDLMATIKNN